jgi:23S rRNA (uracil1939-C5)-methyltransferase
MQQKPDSSPAASYPVTIEKLVYGGDGLGRLPNGKVIFVPWSVPGDHLVVRRLPGQKPEQWETLKTLLPAPERIAARCSVFGQCGGCQWQNISSATQREWKRRIVEESLVRLGKLTGLTVSNTLGDNDTQWNFRNRVQWEVQWNQALQRYLLGYCRAGSHDVVAFETCWIIPDELNRLASWLQDYFSQDVRAASCIRRIEAMQNAEGEILLSLYKNEDAQADAVRLDPLIQTLTQAYPAIVGVVVFEQASAGGQPRFGQSFIFEKILGKRYRVSTGSFFQTNRAATELVLDVLAQWLPPQMESMLDLYAGVGLFSLHFQDRAKRILAVESAPSSVADAQENAKEQEASHIEWFTGDARTGLQNLRETFEVAIVDPPRAGCHREVLTWLNRHITQQLIYVSCNPTTLARDLKILTEAGWTIHAVQPVDMFPQTYHVETLVHLSRI